MSLSILRGCVFTKSQLIEQSVYTGSRIFYTTKPKDFKESTSTSISKKSSNLPDPPSLPDSSSTLPAASSSPVSSKSLGSSNSSALKPTSSVTPASPATPVSSITPSSSSSYSRKQIRQNVQGYVFDRYTNYIKNYDKVLEKKFPAAMKVYRVFAVGVKDFYNDMKQFLRITRIVNNPAMGLKALTRKELELYNQMPKDMYRVAPVLILSTLPFANYVVFPLAYMFPKYWLSSHFWSIQQRYEFSVEFLRQRLNYNLPVFRFMQSKLNNLKENDPENFEKMRSILGRLGSGLHPTPAEILAVNDVFTRPPYNLESLPRSHLKQLCGLHGIHLGLRKQMRLAQHAFIVHHMDLAIRREGGVHNMPPDSLIRACNIRGLNTMQMSNEQMIEWLQQWVEVSLPVNGTNISMFLYLPILISYNHPNNWKLSHTAKS